MSALAPPMARTRKTNTGSHHGITWFTRRQVSPCLNLALLVLVGVTFGTGWIASLLGLTEFGLHKYSSIVMLLVALSHVALHWRSLTSGLRSTWRSGGERIHSWRADKIEFRRQ